MSKSTPLAPIRIELFVYTNGPALPVFARVVAALFGDVGAWRGRAVAKKTEHRVSRLRSVKAAFEKLAGAFEGRLNALHLHGDLAGATSEPLVQAVDITVELSPLAADWDRIEVEDPEFWCLKRNLRRELLSLESTQGSIEHRKIERHPSYMRLDVWPATSTVSDEVLRALARPLAGQFDVEHTEGFVGFADTRETTGHINTCAPREMTRLDIHFDAAHRVTIGASATLERYARDIADAYPDPAQSLEVYGAAAVHSFDTWQFTWKVYLPAWHDAKVH